MPENNMPSTVEEASCTARPGSAESSNVEPNGGAASSEPSSTSTSGDAPACAAVPSDAPADAAAPSDVLANDAVSSDVLAGAAAGSATASATTATSFVPLLTTRDWNAEWKELQKARRHADDAGYWDKRAATFGTKDAPNPYVDRFLELAGVRPGETVFDMGCGTGALAMPLGAAGHNVVAADFSCGMLGVLQGELDARGINCVTTKQMSWEDDWEAHGVGPESADVCMASRSIAVEDIERALLRLNSVARRRVCITLATGSSPRTDERILADLGLDHALGRDYLYAFNILIANGIYPEVSYIRSERADTFESFEDAHENLSKMINDASTFASDEERARAVERLRGWLEENLVENPHAGKPDRKGVPEKRFRLRNPRVITWAFIAWDK